MRANSEPIYPGELMARYRFGGGRGATGAHLKSMGSYELHAWRDAMAIAELLDQTVGAARARQLYEQVESKVLLEFERLMSADIADFIARSESQRPPVIKKLAGEATKTCFLVLSILGCLRAKALMEIRDNYREVLAPGKGNRVTTGSLYNFSVEVINSVNHTWPYEVFSSLGIDDDDGEADGSRPAPVAGPVAPVVPLAPPPPPPVAPLEHTEILVTFGPCDVVPASPGSSEPAWMLQLVEENAEVSSMWLGEKAMRRDSLVKTLASLGKLQWGPKPTLLLLSSSHQALVDEVNAAASERVAGIARKGVTSMAFAKWPTEMLKAIRRELEVIGEAMPSAGELMRARDPEGRRFLAFDYSDPKTQDWERQRDEVEELVRAILAGRGRHVGPTRFGSEPAVRSGAGVRDLAKAKREVTKLHHSDRTALGDGLLEVLEPTLLWRSGDMSTADAMASIGPAYLEYLFRGDIDLGDHLDTALMQLLGWGSLEMSLIDAAVAKVVDGTFCSGGRPLAPIQYRWGGRAPFDAQQRRIPAWFNAWWCVFDGVSKDSSDSNPWLPSAGYLGDEANSLLQGLDGKVRFADRLFPVSLVASPAESRWASGFSSTSTKAARSLVSWLGARGGSQYYSFSSNGSVDESTKWGLLVAVEASTPEAASTIRSEFSAQLASRVLHRILVKDSRGKRGQPPAGLKILSPAIDFLAPWRDTNCRLALSSGLGWDAQARRAFSVKPGS